MAANTGFNFSFLFLLEFLLQESDVIRTAFLGCLVFFNSAFVVIL